MRIIIDLQGAQTESRFRGIGRYSLGLTQSLLKLNVSYEIFIVLNGLFPESVETLRSIFSKLIPNDHILVWRSPEPTAAFDISNSSRHQIAQRLREAFIASLLPDLVLITSLFEGYGDNGVVSIGEFNDRIPTAVILYDLIPLVNPEFFSANKSFNKFYLQQIASLKKANLLLAISDHTKSEAINQLGIHEEFISTIHAACDDKFKKLILSQADKDSIFKRFGITKPFIFYTGGVDERKNLSRLINAYSKLPPTIRNQYQLVFSGKIDALQQKKLKAIAHDYALKANDLLLLNYVSDEELVKLYNICSLFIFPSLHEGFGLPVLEAMACGAAVICANTTSLPDVIGLADAVFDPENILDMTNLMTKALINENFKRTLIEHSKKQHSKFSWERSASYALGALNQFLLKNEKRIHAETEFIQSLRAPDLLQQHLIKSIANIKDIDKSPSARLELAKCLTYNQISREREKLFIDISELICRDAGTGIQRVVKSILNEILKNPPQYFDIVLVYADQIHLGYRNGSHFILDKKNDFKQSSDDRFIDFNPGDIFLGLDFQLHIVTFQKDFFRSMRQKGVLVKFVVYDLLPLTHASFFPNGTNYAFIEWLETIKCAHQLLCISQSTANELKEYFLKQNLNKSSIPDIASFHLGANIIPISENKRNSLPIDLITFPKPIFEIPTFLMVGTIEPRKGYRLVLEAFEEWWKMGAQVVLVIAGKQGWEMDDFIEKIKNHLQYNRFLFWLTHIDDISLMEAYKRSSCLIMASEGEGFGLPLIEAAHHELPIIVRDLPVFREVADKFASYFPINASSNDLLNHLKNWLELYNQSKHPKTKDMPYLSWSQSAKELMNLTCTNLDCIVNE